MSTNTKTCEWESPATLRSTNVGPVEHPILFFSWEGGRKRQTSDHMYCDTVTPTQRTSFVCGKWEQWLGGWALKKVQNTKQKPYLYFYFSNFLYPLFAYPCVDLVAAVGNGHIYSNVIHVSMRTHHYHTRTFLFLFSLLSVSPSIVHLISRFSVSPSISGSA